MLVVAVDAIISTESIIIIVISTESIIIIVEPEVTRPIQAFVASLGDLVRNPSSGHPIQWSDRQVQ